MLVSYQMNVTFSMMPYRSFPMLIVLLEELLDRRKPPCFMPLLTWPVLWSILGCDYQFIFLTLYYEAEMEEVKTSTWSLPAGNMIQLIIAQDCAPATNPLLIFFYHLIWRGQVGGGWPTSFSLSITCQMLPWLDLWVSFDNTSGWSADKPSQHLYGVLAFGPTRL